MNRIKRLSNELLEKYPEKFTINFEENKKIIINLATVRSKVLRNKIAGYITSKIRRESEEAKKNTVDTENEES